MKMLKKLFYTFLAGCMLLSCTDDSYRGAEVDGISDEPIPVQVVVGNPDNMFVTRGHGAVDENSEFWKGSPIYVYAFKKDLLTSFKSTSRNDNWNCLVDGSIDNRGSLAGKVAQIGELDSYATWAGEQVYYPVSTQPYDFYAYFIDDMSVPDNSIVRTDDRISFPVEIDGSQDLMSAKAAFDEGYYNLDGYSEEEKANLMNYSFGAYTAALRIDPVIYFKHHLTRLCFDLYSGYSENTGKEIYVDSIKVRSRTRAEFTVVSKHTEEMGLDFSRDTRPALLYDEAKNLTSEQRLPYLKLKDKNGEKFQPLYLSPSPEEIDPYNIYSVVEPVRAGESLLLAPDTEYELLLYLREHHKSGSISVGEPAIFIFTAPGGGQFKPGYQYRIRLAIYGEMEIYMSVTLTEWNNGGEIEIGEDIPPSVSGR